MKKIFIVSILAFIFGPLFAKASCVGGLSLEDYINQAKMVAVGTVKSQSDGTAVVSVEKYFKGSGEDDINVSGRGSDEAGVITSIDFDFETGKKYLLFFSKRASGDYQTNACSGNKIVETSLDENELKTLGPGQEPTTTETNNTTNIEDKNFLQNPIFLGIIFVALGASGIWVLRKKK